MLVIPSYPRLVLDHESGGQFRDSLVSRNTDLLNFSDLASLRLEIDSSVDRD